MNLKEGLKIKDKKNKDYTSGQGRKIKELKIKKLKIIRGFHQKIN